MDITTIKAAYNGLKAGKEILRSLLDLKVVAEAEEKISAVMSQLGEAQDTLFVMREELFKLQSENENLRRQQSIQDNWEEKIAKYSLVKTKGGAVVYELSAQPHHYACPSCAEKRLLQVLQDEHVASGIHRCVGCDSSFPVKSSEIIGNFGTF